MNRDAETYLRIGSFGITPLLLMLAATGVLHDSRTPALLVVAGGGNPLNVALNLVLLYPIGLGWRVPRSAR